MTDMAGQNFLGPGVEVCGGVRRESGEGVSPVSCQDSENLGVLVLCPRGFPLELVLRGYSLLRGVLLVLGLLEVLVGFL